MAGVIHTFTAWWSQIRHHTHTGIENVSQGIDFE